MTASLKTYFFMVLAVGASFSVAQNTSNAPDEAQQILDVVQGMLSANGQPAQNQRGKPSSRPVTAATTRGKPSAKEINERVSQARGADVATAARDLGESLATLAQSRSASGPPGKTELLESLKTQLPQQVQADFAAMRSLSVNGDLQLRFDQSRRLSGFKGEFSLPGKGDKERRVADLVRAYPGSFGVGPDTELQMKPNCKNSNCTFRVDRVYKGLPVWGGDFTVTTRDDTVISARGLFELGPLDLGDSSRLSREEILAAVAEYFGKAVDDITNEPVIEEGIRVARPMRFHALRVTVEFGALESYHAFVSVASGRVTDVLSRVFTAFEDSQGEDLLGVTQAFRSETIINGNKLVDDQTPPGSVSVVADLAGNDIQLWSIAPTVTAPSPQGPWDPAAVSAITNAKLATSYFQQAFGRNGLDGNGQGTLSVVNATFNGSGNNAANTGGGLILIYGIGDGNSRANHAIADDVAGHEFTHGVVNTTSNLEYKFQSGALNESFSDFFGIMMASPDDWLLGESLYLQGGFMRSMNDPASKGQPATMDDFRYLSEGVDYGGVHINSGIPNRAFYLMAEGLSDESIGTSIGRTRTEQIAYQTMISLPSTANFDQAAEAMYEQAGLLYGPAEQQAVADAFAAVGLPVTSEPPEPPELPSPGTSNLTAAVYPGDGFNFVLGQLFDNDFAGYNAELLFQFNSQSAALKRPALSTDTNGNGIISYFTAANDLIYADIQTGVNTTVLTATPFQSFAFSPALEKYAVTAVSGNVLTVCDVNLASCAQYEIATPDYSTEGVGGVPATLIDSLDWDSTGRMVAFDYAVCLTEIEGSCEVYQWAIGVLNTVTGTVSYPLLGQPDNVDVGYPAFSNLTDRYLAFDLLEYDATDANGFGSSAVIVLDREASQAYLGALADNGLVSGPTGPLYGVPNFTADDSGLVYTRWDASGNPFMFLAELSAYAATGTTQSMDPFISRYPTSSPYLHRPPSLALTATPASSDFGELPVNSSGSIDVCVTNTGSARILVEPATTTDDFIVPQLPGAVLTGGQSLCGSVVVNTTTLTPGSTFSGSVSVPSDGDPLSISVSGSVAATVPTAPVITAVAVDDGEITLQVTVGSDGGSTITSYVAVCSDGSNAIQGTSSTTTIRVSGLTNEVAYTCTVTATNAVGTSATSAASDPVTPEGTANGLPLWLLIEATKE